MSLKIFSNEERKPPDQHDGKSESEKITEQSNLNILYEKEVVQL